MKHFEIHNFITVGSKVTKFCNFFKITGAIDCKEKKTVCIYLEITIYHYMRSKIVIEMYKGMQSFTINTLKSKN